MPSAWWDHYQHVKNVRESLAKEYVGTEGFSTIGITAHPTDYGGKRGFQIKLTVDPTSFDEPVPERRENIPVTVSEEAKEYQPADSSCGDTPPDCYENWCFWDNPPGGIPITADNTGYFGTGCCWVERKGGYYFLTAYHLFDTNFDCSTGGAGVDAYQPDKSDALHRAGEVKWYNINADWALIDGDASHTRTDQIHDGQSAHEVNGVICDGCMADLVGCDAGSVYQLGTTTGRTEGCITEINVTKSDCPDLDGYGFTFDAQNGEGDSGGPIFVDNGSWVYIAGMYHGGKWSGSMCDDDGDGDADRSYGSDGIGIAAHRLRNYYDMTFDLNISPSASCNGNCRCS